MKIIKDLESIDLISESVGITMGTFDGVHIGHQKIIEQLVQDCRDRGYKSLVYTFSNHPLEHASPERAPTKILQLKQKIEIIEKLGVDILVLIPFDYSQRNILAHDFIESILIKKLNMKHIVVGYDFKFGKKAEGTVETLIENASQYGYTYDIVEPIRKDYIRVSSTLIRRLLKAGNIRQANYYLGRRYKIKGRVIRGKQIGRKIGYPTANLELSDNYAILNPGVYITRTIVDGEDYPSVTNVGFNPTFNQKEFNIETYIMGFNRDIYDKEITVKFYKKIRKEIKFKDIDTLKEYIRWDVYNTKKFFDIL